MMVGNVQISFGVKIGWRAYALLFWAKIKNRLGFKVDVEREAERIAKSILYTVDGKVRGRLGDTP